MDWSSIAKDAAVIITALGGREALAWLVNRKTNARKEMAAAKDAELVVYEKQIERYEARLAQRDAKVDGLYNELRAEQRKNLSLTEEVGRLKLQIEVMEVQKCEVRGCGSRKPPSTY